MSKKTAVGQADLRKLMQKVKSGNSDSNGKAATTAGGAKLKKYKLSSRELQLLEEQKRAREEKRAAKVEKAKAAALPQGFFDAKPAKSILKNSSSSSSSPVAASLSAYHAQAAASSSTSSHATTTVKTSPAQAAAKKRTAESVSEDNTALKVQKTIPQEPIPQQDAVQLQQEDRGELPEGFFDDPKLDAKARNQEYRDPAEEEWERFQKEIAQEIDTAQDMVTEEQMEATEDRQLEEVEDQMRAWSKVSQMEKKFTVVEERVQAKKSESGEMESEDSSEDEDGVDDLFNWRTKS